MEKTVAFRDFEERDIDFIYKCKNDPELNKMIVGQWHPFTYEEAVKWVHGCMGEHETFRFWAICTNDEVRRIVGWVSISDIDFENSKACFHSIVIGDPEYRLGFAWIESYMFVFRYVFDILGLETLCDACLTVHPSTKTINPVMYFKRVGTIENGANKNGVNYDIAQFELNQVDYKEHIKKGDYEMRSIIKRFTGIIRTQKNSR